MFSSQDWEKLAKINWRVHLLPFRHPITGATTKSFCTMREDTETILGSGLSDTYEIFQNSEMIEISEDFAQHFGNEAKVSEVWSVKGGMINSIQIQTAPMKLKNGEDIFPNITISNNHGDRRKARGVIGCKRKVCSNGLIAPVGGIVEAFAISHSGNMGEKIFDAKQAAFEAAKIHKVTKEVFDFLAEIKITEDIFQNFVKVRFPNDTTQSDNGKKAIVRNFLDADGGIIERNTVWNAWNAYTKHTIHERRIHVVGGNSSTIKEDARLQSVYLGKTAQDNLSALNDLIELTDNRDAIDRIISKVEF